MAALILGLALFLGMHSISIVRPNLRTDVIQRFGLAPWQAVYGIVSLVGFLMLLSGYGAIHKSSVALYDAPDWLKHVALLLMLPAFPVLFATYLPGRIQTAVKHPMLLAVKIWALSHLLANGGLADVILFGAFLAWAVANRISLKHRVGPPVQGAQPGRNNDAIAIVAGLLVYLLFIFWAHKALIGVSPLG